MKTIGMKTIGLALLIVLMGACEKKDDLGNVDVKGTNVTAKSISLDDSVSSSGEVIHDNNILNCYYDNYSIGFDEKVIRNESAYKKLGEAIREKGICDADSLPVVDFSKNSLIGKYVSGGGCNVNVEREVYDDTETKTITYSIKTEFIGQCDMFSYSWNWMLIPKLNDEYTVKFVTDTK